MTVLPKRAYAPPTYEDGTRILVERLWPRGPSKERTAADLWLTEMAPSPELRRRFGHDPAKWDEFRRRYLEELRTQPEALERLRRLTDGGRVTFGYAARDTEHNPAALLRKVVDGESRSRAA